MNKSLQILTLVVLSGSLAATASADQPAGRSAKSRSGDKAQKKIDKATEQFEKKLTKLRTKYLEKMKPGQMARKKREQIQKEAKSFDGVVKKLNKVGANASAISALEGRRDALIVEILEAHRKAQVGATNERIAKLLSPRNLAKITEGSDRDREKQQAAFDDEVAKLEALGAPQSDIDAAYTKRTEAIDGARSANAAADQERVRGRVQKDVLVVEPTLGAPRIAPKAPSWCDGVVEAKGDRFWKSYQPKAPPNLDERGFDFGYLEAAVLFSCQDPDYDVRQKWTAAFRQQLSNRHLLGEAHNEEIMQLGPALVKDESWEKSNKETLCKAHAPANSGTREARASRALERIALRCGNRLNRENAHRLWDLDVAGGFASQLALAGFVDYFIPELRGNYSDLEEGALGWVTKYVVASAVPLDAEAFEKELSSMKLSPYGNAQARLTFYGVMARMAVYADALKSAAKKNPGIEKMVFAGPAASLARFEKERAAAKTVLDKVLAIEDRLGGEQAINGCAKELFKDFGPYLKTAMKSQEKAAPHEIRFSDMQGYLLAYGLTACGRKDETAPVMDYTFGALYNTMSPIKGPMTAAYRGMVEGYNNAVGDQKSGTFSSSRSGGGGGAKLKAPDRNPVEVPELPHSTHGFTGFSSLEYVASAVVKSVKKSGDEVTVKFGTRKWKEPVLKCKETNKIDRIGSDGKIHYKFKCKKVGEKTVSFTQKPVTVPSWAAAGARKGALLKFTRYSNSVKVDRGWIIEAYKSKKGKKRTALFGAPI